MGFPNVDLYLVDLFIQQFNATLANADQIIPRLFNDRPEAEQANISAYLQARTFTGDIKDREPNRIYILPHFPLTSVPFPQIGVSVGNDTSSDKMLGDETGEVVQIGDDILLEQGYFSHGSWQVDIVADTKPEVIWLTRFCQYFVCVSQMALARLGVSEIGISLADVTIDQEMAPRIAFARGMTVTGRIANTWYVDLSTQTYELGINKAPVYD